MPFYERQPYITPLYQVLLEILRGEIRVPRFQRPGSEVTWTSDQRGDLLDSLYRGFPVGTILLWSTKTNLPSLDKVAGFTIPEADDRRRPFRALLDGHQRLSTLLAILGPGLADELRETGVDVKYEDSLKETWVFETREESSHQLSGTRDRFVLLKRKPVVGTQVPLNIVLSRLQMNDWIRKHDKELRANGIRLAESVRDKLREYAVPVAVLVTDSLDEATESFKRVNSSGTPMDTFHMVAALAYSENSNLADSFAAMRSEYLGPLGWEALAETDILRVCAGLSKNHPAKLDVEAIAKQLKDDKEHSLHAVRACARAAGVLRTLGIHGPAALPYTWQLIVLAITLGKNLDQVDLTDQEKDGVRRWFWITTYGECFAGINSAVYDRASAALREMMAGRHWKDTDLVRDVRYVEEPSRFDFRWARAKAFALLLARQFDEDRTDGNAHRALAEQGAGAFAPLRSGKRRSDSYELIIVPNHDDLKSIRETMRPPYQLLFSVDRHLPTSSQLGFLDDNVAQDIDSRMAKRKEHLLVLEKAFVESFDLEWR